MFSVKKTTLVLLFVTAGVFLASIFQPFGLSPDYESYEDFFTLIRLDFKGVASETRFEPGFSFLAGFFAHFLSTNAVVFGALAAVSIALKIACFRKYSVNLFFYVAVAFYIFKFVPLHELTQLRLSLASGFLIWAFYFLSFFGVSWIFMALAGASFALHYSSLMVLPFLFLPKLGRVQVVLFSISLYLLVLLLSGLLIGIFEKLLFSNTAYNPLEYSGEIFNIFSPVFFPEYFMIVLSLIFWRDLTDGMKKIVAIEMAGFAIFYAIPEYRTVAIRGREYFSVLWALFVVQADVVSLRLKLMIFAFVLASMAISYYLYFVLNFFH